MVQSYSALVVTPESFHTPHGYAQVACNAATQLVPPAGAVGCQVVAEVQAVRWTDDGTVPTTTLGMPLAVGASWVFEGPQSATLQFIAQVAGGLVDVTWY